MMLEDEFKHISKENKNGIEMLDNFLILIPQIYIALKDEEGAKAFAEKGI